MSYLSVIRQKSLTERNETDTCPLTDSKRVHVIDRTISLLSDFLTDSLPSIRQTNVIAALKQLAMCTTPSVACELQRLVLVNTGTWVSELIPQWYTSCNRWQSSKDGRYQTSKWTNSWTIRTTVQLFGFSPILYTMQIRSYFTIAFYSLLRWLFNNKRKWLLWITLRVQ